MHGWQEEETRPGAPRSENKIAFRVFADDLLVIKQVIQEKPQNQYGRDQSTQAHIGIFGEEKCPDAGGVHDQQRILVHLVQVDLEDSQQGAAFKVCGNAGDPEGKNADEEVQKGKILSANVDVQIDRQNKNGLQLQSKGNAQSNEGRDIAPTIKCSQSKDAHACIHGITLTPYGRIENDSGNKENNGVSDCKSRTESGTAPDFSNQFTANHSQQEVEKNGDIFIKVYHGAGKTANQDNERLIQNIVVANLAAHGGKAGICAELLCPGQKMIGHVLRNIVQTRNACQNGHTGNDQK